MNNFQFKFVGQLNAPWKKTAMSINQKCKPCWGNNSSLAVSLYYNSSSLTTLSLFTFFTLFPINVQWTWNKADVRGCTVESRSTDTRLMRTPVLYGQFRLSRQKAHIFSLKLTRFIRTPVETDNGHFSVSRVTNSHILSTPLYGHWLSAHCLFSLSQLCDNCRHCTLFK